MVYDDLTEKQIENAHNILDKANANMFAKFKEDFPHFKIGSSNDEAKVNVSHALMIDDIPIPYFQRWASHLFLNSANAIFFYQLKNSAKYKGITKNTKLNSAKVDILDVDNTINNIKLINVDSSRNNQVLFSFAMPCQIEDKKTTTLLKDIYFAYVWIDFNRNALIFSIPQYPNHFSINNKIIKKNQYEQIANEIFTFFNDLNISFTFSDVDWVLDSFSKITQEFFDHNNPVIYETMGSLQKHPELAKIVNTISTLDSNLNNDLTKRRLKKSLLDILETELIRNLGPVIKSVPFNIFLQEVTKGSTDYKASNKKLPFDSDESREIIKKMVEHGEINALGFSYNHDERDYKYKIYIGNEYFALRRLTNGQTRKEVVEDVLSEFIKYKPAVQSKPASRIVRKTK